MTKATPMSKPFVKATAVLFLLVAVMFWRVLLIPNTVLGDNYDFIRQFLPQRTFQVMAIKMRTIPSWNPFDLMGVPYIASFQPAFFSPSTLFLAFPLAFLDVEITPKILSSWQVIHLFFAGAGILVLGRLIRISPAAALVGALTYATSGFLVAQAGHVNQQNTAAWIPWALAALVHLSRRPNMFRLAIACITFSCLVLSGHAQIAIYGALAISGLGAILLTRAWVQRGSAEAFQLAVWFVVAAVGAILLSAAQIFPFMEYAELSIRAGQGYDFATSYSLPLGHLSLLAAPGSLGVNVNEYTGRPSLYETFGYAGLMPMLLLPFALRHKRLRIPARLLLAAALTALLLALGNNGPLYPVLFEVIRGIVERFRNPGRALVLFDLSMALLAAIGTDALLRNLPLQRKHLRGPVVILALLVIVMVFAGPMHVDNGFEPDRIGLLKAFSIAATAGLFLVLIHRFSTQRLIAVSLIAFVALDLGLANANAFLIEAPSPVYQDEALARLARTAEGYEPAEIPSFRFESDAATLGWEQNNGAVIGVPKTMGDDSLVMTHYVELRRVLGTTDAQGVQLELFGDDALASPILDMLGAKYLVTTRSPDELTQKARMKHRPYAQTGEVWLYQNPDAFPIAWLVGKSVSISNPADLENLDLRSEMGVSNFPSQSLSGPGPAGSITETDIGLTDVSFSVNVNEGGGFLVVTIPNHPGWKVDVDGKPTPKIRANHAFQAVKLKPGFHRVNWTFDSDPLRRGSIVSLTTLLLIVIAATTSKFLKERAGD